MSLAPRTPGPWVVEEQKSVDGPFLYSVCASKDAPNRFGSYPGSLVVADCMFQSNSRLWPPLAATARANATFIATAPQMYSVLRLLADEVERVTNARFDRRSCVCDPDAPARAASNLERLLDQARTVLRAADGRIG